MDRQRVGGAQPKPIDMPDQGPLAAEPPLTETLRVGPLESRHGRLTGDLPAATTLAISDGTLWHHQTSGFGRFTFRASDFAGGCTQL